MNLNKEECHYTKFNIENHEIIFGCSGDSGILVSIPFTKNTPQSIVDKLNEVIFHGMDEWSRLGTWNGLLKGNMLEPKHLLLNARMQISYDHESGVKYYIAVTITDFEPDAIGTWIDNDIRIDPADVLYHEMAEYCGEQLNKILFPVL